MSKKLFGILNTGHEIYEYTLKSENAEVKIITFGAAIREFTVFGTDIIGGYDTLEDYIADDSHQGAIIGRVANRIENARFFMDGKEYALPKNDGNNCLHGGEGFDRRSWDVIASNDNSITLTLHSENGDQGFPSALDVSVTYTLSDTALIIDYRADPHGKTPIALTNHAYFNLNGLGGNILTHTAQIFADHYTEVNSELIPNGNRPSVSGTVFDFNFPKQIGKDISAAFGGYDHNYILSPADKATFGEKLLPLVARVSADRLVMNVYTDQPSIQFYIGNFLGGAPDFKGGVKRIRHGAFCLEAQTEPNCINHGIGFYDKNEPYLQITVYKIDKKD